MEHSGHVGVDLFFVLSGFLIYGSVISKPQNLWEYMRRRVERIYPAFLVVLTLYLVLSFLFPAESKLPAGSFDGFLYVLSNILLLPGITSIQPIIVVAWSLSYEFCFYLAAPTAIWLLGMRNWAPRYRILFLLAVSGAIVALSISTVFPHTRMIGFLSGMIL